MFTYATRLKSSSGFNEGQRVSRCIFASFLPPQKMKIRDHVHMLALLKEASPASPRSSEYKRWSRPSQLQRSPQDSRPNPRVRDLMPSFLLCRCMYYAGLMHHLCTPITNAAIFQLISELATNLGLKIRGVSRMLATATWTCRQLLLASTILRQW